MLALPGMFPRAPSVDELNCVSRAFEPQQLNLVFECQEIAPNMCYKLLILPSAPFRAQDGLGLHVPNKRELLDEKLNCYGGLALSSQTLAIGVIKEV
eukprot:4917711-Amphidinium_carterae.2